MATSEALREARRFVRVRYFSFLASIVILFGLLVISSIVLVVSLLGESSWEQQAASGAVAGGALLLLILIQYRPAAGFAAAATELSTLEALGAHLQRSYSLWDGFLEERDSSQRLVANEVALAVSSMTSATREIVSLQTTLLETRRTGRSAGPEARPAFPSPVNPDPRRY